MRLRLNHTEGEIRGEWTASRCPGLCSGRDLVARDGAGSQEHMRRHPNLSRFYLMHVGEEER